MRKICYNGNFYDESEAVLKAGNRSYRYGFGFFETIQVSLGKILLQSYHQNRITRSAALLNAQLPAHSNLSHICSLLLDLCRKNNCLNAARVRLSFSVGEGGLFDEDNRLHYLIEAWPLEAPAHLLNENGLTTGFFPSAKKSCDVYANIKSAAALIYAAAAAHCRGQKWNECIILNQRENICETTIANLFWIKDARIYTPSLTEGCVDGVMRSWLIDKVQNVTETPCRPIDLLEADEVFVTNALKGIRWVQSVENISYKNTITRQLHQLYIQPLFS